MSKNGEEGGCREEGKRNKLGRVCGQESLGAEMNAPGGSVKFTISGDKIFVETTLSVAYIRRPQFPNFVLFTVCILYSLPNFGFPTLKLEHANILPE